MWDGYKGLRKGSKIRGDKIYKASLNRFGQVGDTRREGRLVMGYQPAFCCWFEKCCLNMSLPVAD